MVLSAALAKLRANPKRIYVYILHRPDGCPFYVGMGVQRRLSAHEREAKKGRWGHKYSVIRKIHNRKESVGYSIVFVNDRKEAMAEERRLIALYGRTNTKTGCLTNLTDGGEGNSGAVWVMTPARSAALKKFGEMQRGKTVSQEARAQISDAVKAMWSDPEYRNKTSAAMSAAKSSPEARAQISELRKGKKHSTEAKRRISEGNRKCKRTPEQKARYSEALKLVWSDPEMRAKKLSIAAANGAKRRGEKQSEEHKAKVRAAVIARGISPEHRAKINAAHRKKREARLSAQLHASIAIVAPEMRS